MRKAKKLLTLLLCITAMLSLCFTLTACMGGGDPGVGKPEQTGCENGHSIPEWNTDTPATCTQDGVKSGYCGNCKEWITEDIPATGHTEETVPGTPATCTTNGSTDKVYCSECDTVITASTVIPAGHVRGELLEYSVFDYKVVVHFDCLACEDLDTVDLPSLSDESWTMNLVGEEEIYTCQVKGETVSVVLSLFIFSEEGNSYSGEYYKIIGYRGNSTSPTIPSVYNGKPVTRIGDGAFEDNTTITSIVIPDSITAIGDSAFKNCTNLTSVTLPEDLTGIGATAFYNCSKLEAIDLPEGVTDIGHSAFAGCTSLTELVIPTTLSSVSPDMCSGCTSLVSVTYADADWATKDDESLPYGVQLRTSAFANCTSLKTVSIPAINIDYGPFSGCDALESLTLKEVTVHGISALGRLFSLDIGVDENDTVPASLTELTIWESIYFRTIAGLDTLEKLTVCNVDNAVAEAPNLMTCEGLKEVTFRNVRSVSNINQMPNLEKVTVINVEDFIGPTNCPLLTEVNIIGNLNSIRGFSDCASLTTVRFPESIGTFSDEYSIPFRNCPLLETTTENGATYFGSEDNPYMFLIAIDSEETELTVKDGTWFVCGGSQYVTKLNLPASVRSINAIFDEALEEVTYAGTANDWFAINLTYANPMVWAETLTLKDGLSSEEVTEVVFGKYVTELRSETVKGFSGLKTVTLHPGITAMDDVFNETLENVYYDGEIIDWLHPYFGVYFEEFERNPMYYAEHFFMKNEDGEYYELTELAVPEYTQLSNYKFAGFEHLTTVILPNYVGTLYNTAFEGTPLKYVFYSGTAEEWSRNVSNDEYYKENFDVYFYSETEPTDTEALYWHYDENGKAVPWSEATPPAPPAPPTTNTVAGNTYRYVETIITVSDQYWMMIEYAKAEGMLEYIAPDALTLEIMQTSSTKAEFEQKLTQFSQQTGANLMVTFAESTLTLSQNGQTATPMEYREVDGKIEAKLTANMPFAVMFYLDTATGGLYELNADDYTSVKHIYEKVVD